MSSVCVKIDLPKLRARLSSEQHRRVELDDVSEWLKEVGFSRQGIDWYCDAESLARLRPEEIRERRTFRTEHGVTLIE